jgi:hypothetical protein
MPSLSVDLRNAMLDALVATIGASPVIEIRTGPEPTITSADAGTLLATVSLEAAWASAAAGGSVTLVGPSESASVAATGTAEHYRLKSSGGTVHMSGSVSSESGLGELRLDSNELFAGGFVTITSWYFNAA